MLLLRCLRAETLRTKGSSVMWLPLLGILIGALSGVSGWYVSAASGPSVQSLLNWQGLYITGMAAPLTTLFAGLVVQRERRTRSGGTPWRPIAPLAPRTAQLLVLAGLIGVFLTLSFGTTWVFAVARGYSSTSVILRAGLLCWLGQLGILGLFLLLAKAAGLIPALLAAVAWQVLGTMSAESPLWWLCPPAWAVRLLLPSLQSHANLVPLDAGEQPVNVWPVFLACVLLATLSPGTALVYEPTRVSRPRRLPSSPPDSPAHMVYHPGQAPRITFAGALRAAFAVPRGRGVYPLFILTLIVLFYAALTYPPLVLTGLTTFMFLPLGTAITVILAWGGAAPAWQVSVTHNPAFRGAFTSFPLLMTAAMSLIAAVLTVIAGESPRVALLRSALWCATGAVLVLLWLLLVVRFSVALTLGGAVVLTIFSLTLGGDVLATTPLWLAALPSWGESALVGTRPLIALGACGVLMVLLGALVRHAYRRFEGR
ncbi:MULTISPECIES: hypothetical protein [unclassified Corynebacterium]|uniref:hypothetical protein n=1 Tax=unclassified Corynebacterium TaxID=2624378 RepID=UPI0029CA307F|nr:MULTISPECIES: hypothetical protein [unclassified Corynebacterium]WPF66925.1 hypothetical protein OLX12_04155 [Corynebacterium sp. 22KM0430]WPF69412.1 hypothetical protein OLW90_04150 [Corynebacterium sp. 21KM1197]